MELRQGYDRSKTLNDVSWAMMRHYWRGHAAEILKSAREETATAVLELCPPPCLQPIVIVVKRKRKTSTQVNNDG